MLSHETTERQINTALLLLYYPKHWLFLW